MNRTFACLVASCAFVAIGIVYGDLVVGQNVSLPTPDAGYITDVADVLSDQQEEEIEQLLWRVEEKTGLEIAVVTVRSISDHTLRRDIEGFAREVFDSFGIGNLPKNDGVLFLVAVNDRKARIELGEGYTKASDDVAAAIMQDTIVPHFRKGEMPEGIRAGTRDIVARFAGNFIFGFPLRVSWTTIYLLCTLPVVGLIIYSLANKGKRGWGWVTVGVGIILVLGIIRLLDVYVFSRLRRFEGAGDSDSWSSGGFGGDSGGGFGGGSSGGGGATGSW
jgi:uncharacterized protein